jgi:nucleoside-diphosphate-sugar epimerase
VILGPAIHYASAEGIESSDVSTSSLYAALAAGKDSKIPDTAFTAWADVRNVAFALFSAATNGKNGRYGIYDGDFDWELLAKDARKIRPDLDASIPYVAEDKKTPVEQGTYSIDTTKAEKELGFKRQFLYSARSMNTS